MPFFALFGRTQRPEKGDPNVQPAPDTKVRAAASHIANRPCAVEADAWLTRGAAQGVDPFLQQPEGQRLPDPIDLIAKVPPTKVHGKNVWCDGGA